MTPRELRDAANAMMEKSGGEIEVDYAIWSTQVFASKPPARVIVRYGLSKMDVLIFEGETFEEALELAELGWPAKRAELRSKALADARARVAALEAA